MSVYAALVRGIMDEHKGTMQYIHFYFFHHHTSGPASIIDLPVDITGRLVATGLASYIFQEAQKVKYYKRCDQGRKATEAAACMEKKVKKRNSKKKLVTSRQVKTRTSPRPSPPTLISRQPHLPSRSRSP